MGVRTLFALFALFVSGPAYAEDVVARPVVVELFTSQGCSLCPQANEYAAELATREDVIALSFSVDYWDYLGWRDTRARPEFTERQRAYVDSLDNRRVYTPQMVIGGAVDSAATAPGAVEAAIASRAAAALPGPMIEVQVDGDVLNVRIGPGETFDSSADIWLVEFEPGVEHAAIGAGENEGRDMMQPNMVTALIHIGEWSGYSVEFSGLELDAAACAILVQASGQGPILAARQVLPQAPG